MQSRDFGSYGIILTNTCLITVAMDILLRDFGSYGIILMNVCVVIIVTMVELNEDFRTYGIIFTIMSVLYFRFSRYS
jgi:hypothetical protein